MTNGTLDSRSLKWMKRGRGAGSRKDNGQRLTLFWPLPSYLGISNANESDWLISIFRKHQKSFNYPSSLSTQLIKHKSVSLDSKKYIGDWKSS